MNGGGRVVGACGAALVVFLAMVAWRRTGDVVPNALRAEGRSNLFDSCREGSRMSRPAVKSSGTNEREVGEEAKIDAFDDLTDKWMEQSAKGVTMSDVDAFAKSFRDVPKVRQDECIHRALNLIPDENVMLLAGILMDKTMDKEIIETVYNDILNRDEDVKMPILTEIFKDKSHPCWSDTAWILDVTGEKPAE